MKNMTCWAIGGFLFTSILGTLLHFAFKWSGGDTFVALFSAVNESIWEHMKLILVPMVVFSLIQYRYAQGIGEGYWCQKLRSILVALVLIPVIYYTYTGILGKSVDWFNIAIFFISGGIAYRSEALRFRKEEVCPVSRKLAVCMIIAIGLSFVLFTFCPPRIPLFADPRTGQYGFLG